MSPKNFVVVIEAAVAAKNFSLVVADSQLSQKALI